MSDGLIEVLVGPMFAGKTTNLIAKAEKLENDVIVFKPSFDTRYALTDIKSHNGSFFHAISVSCIEEMVIPSNIKTVIIDEIQFFNEPCFKGNIIHKVMNLKHSGLTVICAGLDKNWQGEDFLISSKIANLADRITILKAKCAVCGEPAAFTFKKSGTSEEIELGAEDLYEPRCEQHFYNFTEYSADLNGINNKITTCWALLKDPDNHQPANENKYLTDL